MLLGMIRKQMQLGRGGQEQEVRLVIHGDRQGQDRKRPGDLKIQVRVLGEELMSS